MSGTAIYTFSLPAKSTTTPDLLAKFEDQSSVGTTHLVRLVAGIWNESSQAETQAILSDEKFARDVAAGLAEIDAGDKLYSFEEVFGVSLDDAL